MSRERERGDRGRPAGFDRKTGEVFGSGAGIANPDDRTEDYDSDLHVDTASEKPAAAKKDVSPGGAN